MDVNDNTRAVCNNNVSGKISRSSPSLTTSKTAISMKELQNLNAPGDETSRFLEDFDPSKRRSSKIKKVPPSYNEEDVVKKLPSLPSQGKQQKKKTVLFDSKGLLLHNQLDLCDCLMEDCPGCHFRCPKCQSQKCGHQCRNNRRWEYDSVKVDGDPSAFRDNGFKSKPDINKYY